MNQKAFAIFVGAIMIVSAFAGFVLMGSNQNETIVVSNPDSLQTFGVQGRLVDWNFDGLKDVLEMSPAEHCDGILDQPDSIAESDGCGPSRSSSILWPDLWTPDLS